MRAVFIPAIVLAMSVPAAALAQGQQSGGQQSSGQQSSSQGSQKAQAASTRSYKEVESSLKQAGIQDVKTLNAAYLVSAVTKDGEHVTFVIDPPGSATPASGGSQQSGGQDSAKQAALRGQQQVRDDLTKAGFKSVQILDAAYLATGKTKNGDEITMMIDPTATTASSGSSGSGSQSGSSAQPSGKTQ